MFLLAMSCHHFDTLRYVVGAEPEAVRVVSWNPAWGWHAGDASHVAVFEFPDGLMAIHRATGCSNGAVTPWHGKLAYRGSGGEHHLGGGARVRDPRASYRTTSA